MKKYKNVVVLTGAGISQESGLNTFRGHEGLWENHRVEDVATPEAFIRDPELVYRFYNHRRENLKNVEPNLAHFALSKLEEEFEGNVTIITQNIDNLHERGEVTKFYICMAKLRKRGAINVGMSTLGIMILMEELHAHLAKLNLLLDHTLFGLVRCPFL